MASLCRMCGDKAEFITTLLDTSQHHLQWAINHFDIEFDGVLPTSVCVHCDNLIREWTLFLNKRKVAKSLFSSMIANKLSLLHQLHSCTLNTSEPSKPSTSVCSTRLSYQKSDNLLQQTPVDCTSVNNIFNFATPIEAIYLPDVESESDLIDSQSVLETSSNSHFADKQQPIQIEKPSNTASLSVPGTEKLQHPLETHQLTSHTSNTSLAGKLSFAVPSNTQCSISTNASSLLYPNLLQHLVKKYHIKDLSIRVLRLSDQVLESLQKNNSVDCNVVDKQMSEQRNVLIKLEPVTVDPCVCNDGVTENQQQIHSSTVDDDDIEVPFEAIYDPVVKCEPDLVKTEPILHLLSSQIDCTEKMEVSVKQEKIGNAEEYSDVQPGLPELESSPETSNLCSNKDVNTIDPVFRCALCKFTAIYKCKIRSHIVNKHVKMSRYQCQECNKSYQYKCGLRYHISHVHHDKCSYKCLLCKQGFQLEKRFNAHIKNHEKTLQCDVCGKILSSKQRLTEHKMIIHTKSSPLSCNICRKIYYTEASLKAHTKAAHSNLSYKCDICDKSFKSKLRRCEHQLEVHASVLAFPCNQCEKSFVSKSKLKQHSIVHSDLRLFKCDKCGSCFKNISNLMSHIRTVHSNVKAFKCHLCGKSFKSNRYLTPHLIRHSNIRNYKCEQCGKLSKTKDDLIHHLTSHSEMRPFACAQCDKKFKCKANLVEHLDYVHSDVRPFSCDKCPYACKSKSDLNKHQVVHSNVRKFECHHCKSKFKRRNYLNKHIKTMHSNFY